MKYNASCCFFNADETPTNNSQLGKSIKIPKTQKRWFMIETELRRMNPFDSVRGTELECFVCFFFFLAFVFSISKYCHPAINKTFGEFGLLSLMCISNPTNKATSNSYSGVEVKIRCYGI